MHDATGMNPIVIPLTPTTRARIELVALSPSGPYRLTVAHPATRLVEYFTSSAAAIDRWGQVEMVLSGSAHTEDLPPAA
jgi:hypothetical protein